MKRPKKNMRYELKKYKDSVYFLNTSGKLIKIHLESLNDYDHSRFELHHYIQYQAYVKEPEWYQIRGIEQKLILVSKICHEHIENRGIRNLTDDEFAAKYKINRSELLFNKRTSEY